MDLKTTTDAITAIRQLRSDNDRLQLEVTHLKAQLSKVHRELSITTDVRYPINHIQKQVLTFNSKTTWKRKTTTG